jgi:hypothetical protein
MTEKIHIGEQICLRPTPEQLEIIFEACKLCGYAQDGNGVLALLMNQLLVDEEGDEDEEDARPTDSPLGKIVQYYKDNPEQLQKTINIGKAIFGGLRK